jgi:serine/threonine-protein kinase HipA
VTDYRSVEQLEVLRDGERAAVLNRLPKGCEFRYETSFLGSAELPIALNLPMTPEPLVTEGILNLPTYFAGLLPEGVMFTAAQTLIGSAKDDLFAVLAATGRDAIGDVEVRVPGARDRPPALNLQGAKEAIAAILDHGRGNAETIAAISGVQPKLSIGNIVRASRSARYIAKFPSPTFPGLLENEAACMALARKCGLWAPRAKVINGVYVVERSDRQSLTGGGVTRIHVEDMLQVMNLFPHSKYSVDFDVICQEMERVGVSIAGILEALKLYAFSYTVGNGDLHAKNVSLMRRDSGQWVPSPAYDIVSTLPYKAIIDGGEAMALALADEAIGRFDLRDFVAFGNRFGIPAKASENAVTSLALAVKRHAPRMLADALPADAVEIVVSRAESLVSQ